MSGGVNGGVSGRVSDAIAPSVGSPDVSSAVSAQNVLYCFHSRGQKHAHLTSSCGQAVWGDLNTQKASIDPHRSRPISQMEENSGYGWSASMVVV